MPHVPQFAQLDFADEYKKLKQSILEKHPDAIILTPKNRGKILNGLLKTHHILILLNTVSVWQEVQSQEPAKNAQKKKRDKTPNPGQPTRHLLTVIVKTELSEPVVIFWKSLKK